LVVHVERGGGGRSRVERTDVDLFFRPRGRALDSRRGVLSLPVTTPRVRRRSFRGFAGDVCGSDSETIPTAWIEAGYTENDAGRRITPLERDLDIQVTLPRQNQHRAHDKVRTSNRGRLTTIGFSTPNP